MCGPLVNVAFVVEAAGTGLLVFLEFRDAFLEAVAFGFDVNQAFGKDADGREDDAVGD